MCLAVPARIVQIEGSTALVEIGGVRRRASLMLLEDAQVGEYILLHAGFAIQKVDEEEARETLAALRSIDADEIHR